MIDPRPAPLPTDPGNRVAVPLAALRPGTRATVSGGDLAPADRALLRAMGLTDRALLRVCRQGEPCIVEVGERRVGLAREIARLLHTLPTPG